MKFLLTVFLTVLIFITKAQLVPSQGENIDFLTTFGKDANSAFGDDDFTQVFFFLIPKTHKKSIYIRVFDPNLGGKHDQVAGGKFDTQTTFSLYAGEGVHSYSDTRKENPVGDFEKGNLLATKTFGSELTYDNKWYTFGPFNPLEGEFSDEYDGYVFKLVCNGLKGDDGNLYRYFLSTEQNENREVEGANAFTYEYSFRLKKEANKIAHLYPFIDGKVESIEQYNFDLDNDGKIELYSIDKNGETAEVSGNNKWAKSSHKITADERGGSIDYQIIKQGKSGNDMVVYILNQYNNAVPFFSNPIGGPPKYKYKINIKYNTDK